MTAALILLVALLAASTVFLLPWWRRRLLLARPFPGRWEAWLPALLPAYIHLEALDRHRLKQLIKIFLDEKRFHSCRGQAIDERLRLIIAAHACLLLLGRGGPVYPGLRHILVYPSGFRSRQRRWQEDGTVSEEVVSLLGESWDQGKVILSWSGVEADLVEAGNGHSVLLHEFAHQLDAESGETNGRPPLPKALRHEWQTVLEDCLTRLREGLDTSLDPYAGTNLAELFAVATENFFDSPWQLAADQPRLFDLLCRAYGMDPRYWRRVLPTPS